MDGSESRYRLAVIAVCVLAAVAYVYRLGSQSFWFDESASFVNASLSWHDFGEAIRRRDVFFAAYYAVLHLWMRLGSSEAMLRAPSVIGAVAALPCMFALGKRLFGNRAGLVATVLLASNNLFLLHVREARPYAWLVLFAILSSLSFMRALDAEQYASADAVSGTAPNKAQAWMWYVAACAAGTYVHVFALLVPLSHGVALALFPGKRPWKAFFFAAGGITAAVAPLVMFILGQESTSGRAFAGHGNPRDLVYLFRIFCGSKASALLYAALGVFAYARRPREGFPYAFLLCWMFAPPCVTLIVSHFVPLFLETYLLVALPPLLLLIAGAAATVFPNPQLLVPAVCLFVALNLPGAFKAYDAQGEKEDWRGVVASATTRMDPKGALAIFPATDVASLAYYERNLARRERPALAYPERSYRIWLPPPPLDMVNQEEIARRYARLWVIADQDAPEANAQAEGFARMLAGAFRLKRTERFTGVLVKQYERASRRIIR